MAAKSPGDPDQRFLARVKGNLCAPPAVLSYEIEPVGKTSRVVWTGERPDLTADTILGAETKSGKQAEDLKTRLGEDRTKVYQALEEKPDTKTAIKEKLKTLSGTRIKDAIDTLLEDGYIRKCKVEKNGKRHDGFEVIGHPD